MNDFSAYDKILSATIGVRCVDLADRHRPQFCRRNLAAGDGGTMMADGCNNHTNDY